jgi:two-component system, chemotaxis family, sensor kinase CheA
VTAYYQKMFIQDARGYLERLNPLLAKMESGSAGIREIDEAFRLMHSIKSEAAHLAKKGIADYAHIAESVLQELREKPGDTIHLDQLFKAVAEIEKTVTADGSSADNPLLSGENQKNHVQKDTDHSRNRSVKLKKFETLLLREARDRGESFYRMICEFDDQTEMTYPKSVLILNNLEQLVNVIRSHPDVSVPFEGHEISPEYYFTTNRPEKEFFDAVKVDQVKRVFLTRLDWEQFLVDAAPRGSREKAGKGDSLIVVKWKELIALWYNYLRGKLQCYMVCTSGDESCQTFASVFDEMGDTLQNTRYVPFETAFQDFSSIVQRSAAEQGKDARCVIQGGHQLIERWFVSRLRDSLVQLLRNAVSHGIEEPSTRLKAGKSPRGDVNVLYQRDEKEIHIFIQDDGRGIDEKSIRNKAMELELDAAAPLLNIITSPGFTTSEMISLEAGRGIGLDIVAAEINRTPGASIRLESKENQGARFCISMPVEISSRDIYFARYKQYTLAIDGTVLLEHVKPQQGEFHRNEAGRVQYRGCPVYTCEGYLFWSEGFSSEDTLIKIRDKQTAFYLLVEDLLFKETFPADLISLSEERGEVPLSQLSIGDQETEIRFVHSDKLDNLYRFDSQ